MSATDRIAAGVPMPRIGAVRAVAPLSVDVEWSAGPRAGRRETVSLAPDLHAYRIYRPLRFDPALFASVHLVDEGAAIAWGSDDAIDMPATSVERLAAEAMSNEEFAAFLSRNRLSLDAAAAELGISRRLVAYYAKDRPVPRHIALACAHIELRRAGGGLGAVA
ncbi:hypothetical protein [Prosthecomicrobium pneumaticum]|uniref:DUF2442 domain-containing protein n=1 Tax=Prosthecomicrobium pneumaticum TaxID=81895 RepID=A0A7W9FM69_9HYPH|nr:hypothetical protein [Prosthecomicrobium pneumaticum]MBB5753242.1 hypothetical protein [Prosthecomicrobium pneumaticum]